MANELRGEIECVLKGTVRNLKFSMNTFRLWAKLFERDFIELGKLIQTNPFETYTELVTAALWSEAYSNGQKKDEIDFDVDQVGSWVDAMPEEKQTELYEVILIGLGKLPTLLGQKKPEQQQKAEA